MANELSAIHGGRVDRVYTNALNGFAVEMTEGRAIAMSKDPRVAWVEEDSEISLSDVQPNATWGLDRIDQRGLPVDTLYNYNQTGSGVRAYVIDSGIRTTHADFGGRLGSDGSMLLEYSPIFRFARLPRAHYSLIEVIYGIRKTIARGTAACEHGGGPWPR